MRRDTRYRIDPIKAAEQMSDLIKNELEIEISPVKLLEFIRSNWGSVSHLSHSIMTGREG